MLGGSVLMNVTFGATINKTAIQTGAYGNGIAAFLRVNKFEATAFLRANDLILDFPLNLPNTGVAPADKLVLALNKGSFSVDFFVKLKQPVDVSSLFQEADDANSTKFDYGGTLVSRFPVDVSFQSDADVVTASPTVSFAPSSQPSVSVNPTVSAAPSHQPSASANPTASAVPSNLPSVSVAPSSQPSAHPSVSAIPSSQPSMRPSPSADIPPAVRFGVVVLIKDGNLFRPAPSVEYEFDICPIVAAIKSSVQGLADNLIKTATDKIEDLTPASLTINLDKITG